MSERKPPEEIGNIFDKLTGVDSIASEVQEQSGAKEQTNALAAQTANPEEIDPLEEQMEARFEAAMGDTLLSLIMADGKIDAGEIDMVLRSMGFSELAQENPLLKDKVTMMIEDAWQALNPDGKSMDEEEKELMAAEAAVQIAKTAGHLFQGGVQGKNTQPVSQSTPGMDASKGQGQGI